MASFADGGEILDGMITRSRGEIRHVCSPKVTSSSPTAAKDFAINSPRLSDKVYSPRISEIKGDHSPRRGVRGPFSPRTLETRPSNLGKSGQNLDK